MFYSEHDLKPPQRKLELGLLTLSLLGYFSTYLTKNRVYEDDIFEYLSLHATTFLELDHVYVMVSGV